MLRSLLFCCLFIGYALHGSACDCFDVYRPLTEEVCRFDTLNAAVFEILIRENGAKGISATIERVIAGNAVSEQIFIISGSRGNCGYDADELPVGKRYLFFGRGTDIPDRDYFAFRCIHSGNLYELNEQKTEIRYLVRGEEYSPGLFTIPGIEWQDYPYANGDTDCDSDSKVTETKIEDIAVYPNPGNGLLQLQFPQSFSNNSRFSISVHDFTGRIVGRSLVSVQSPEINLTQQPAGVYQIRLTVGAQSRLIRYVKQ